ncbi:MAG: nucleotide exchange factor GrpE [Dermatophilaceae bacterium]
MTQPADPADPREKLAPVEARAPRARAEHGTRASDAGSSPDAPASSDVVADLGEVTDSGGDVADGDVADDGGARPREREVPPDEGADVGSITPSIDQPGDLEQGSTEPDDTESVGDGEEAARSGAGATLADPADAGGEPGDVDAQRRSAGGDLAAERLADLQRLQAEYVNYKRRVDRDRTVVQARAVRDVLESLLPVLDDLHLAREHGDLAGGPFAAIADKLEATLARYGLERFGTRGEEFDPSRHEALMHAPWPDDDADLPQDGSATTVVTVLQPGYRAGDHVLRPARVAVADPG